MAVITRGAQLEKDLEAAAAAFSDDGDDNDTDNDDERVPEPVGQQVPVEPSPVVVPMLGQDMTEDQSDGYEAYKARLWKTVEKRISAYRAKLDAKMQAFVTAQETAFQGRLDEYALRVGDVSHISDPVKAREAVQRQIATHQTTLDNLQKQLAAIAK